MPVDLPDSYASAPWPSFPLRLLERGDPAYPPSLAALARPPARLWLRGTSRLTGSWGAVVGSRRADLPGLAAAAEIAAGLVQAGVGVLSGGALGIDAAAHRGALEAGGRTVAVLPGGLDRPTPVTNQGLFLQLLRAGGLLVGECPPGTPVWPGAFSRRNLLLAALARVVIVVQAGGGSGTLITADHARRLGRPLLVVPGGWRSPGREGCHALLRAGAWPVGSPGELDAALHALDLVRPGDAPDLAARGPTPERSAAASAGPAGEVLQLLARGPRTVEQLAVAGAMGSAALLALLTELELGGQVRSLGGGLFGLGPREAHRTPGWDRRLDGMEGNLYTATPHGRVSTPSASREGESPAAGRPGEVGAITGES
ncbi:MAG: DNA-processing protein DprA [Myxococcota bacterium]|jgi:DNA processing protein|nr:DNA-processing protein DprA [Myxococcota bacterium]